ncbi:MAG: hypothetical protein Ct9H90mP16_11570 [Candidatus Poseidoniales archaeon]|nr:MAG: hypothetical protein Ct9H90mP16_11570 [Candidatus Poseidoniales archaeon]
MTRNGIKSASLSLTWAIVLIWFGANLLSQALYLGFYGEPYDANQILKSLGAWYWVCVFLELVIWLTFGSLLVQKFRLDVSNPPVGERVLEVAKDPCSEFIPPMSWSASRRFTPVVAIVVKPRWLRESEFQRHICVSAFMEPLTKLNSVIGMVFVGISSFRGPPQRRWGESNCANCEECGSCQVRPHSARTVRYRRRVFFHAGPKGAGNGHCHFSRTSRSTL